jgi:hypothetical protein
MKSSFFYSNQDIQSLKEVIRTGEPVGQIAARLYTQYETTEGALANKLYSIKKTTRKIAKWDGPKRIRTKRVNNTIPSETKEAVMPEGFTFEGTPKKVTFCLDHFRVYF